MKLSNKIIVRIMLSIILILAVDGYVSLSYELEHLNNDMKRDSQILGHAMQQVILSDWSIKGENYVLKLIEKVNKRDHQIKIRWVWLDSLPKAYQQKLIPLTRGEEVYFLEKSAGYRYAYIPVQVDSERYSAIELTEPLSNLENYTRKIILRLIILTISLTIVSSIMVRTLCVKFISNPLQKLVEKSYKIGTGDLSSETVLYSQDELAILDVALSDMCKQLAKEKEATRLETEARLATLEQLRHTERLAMLGKLTAGVAHELGTPLNVVAGRAKIIAYEDVTKGDIHQCSKIIQGQAERMTKIIQQLLDFARRRKHHKSPTDIEKLIKKVLDMLGPMAKKNKVVFKLQENTNFPLVLLDQSQMEQVLINLVINGIQAIPDGGQLELGFDFKCLNSPKDKKEQEHLVIYVKDEGVGISKENLKLIFDPFFTTKDVGKGTGLGLSIAYGIVEEHEGWIDVASELGKGSLFSVCFLAKRKK